MSGLVAAIDQGTSSTRCLLFDASGRALALARRGHRQICPRPGWVEHDPLEILRATEAVVREALAAVGASARDVAAVGVTNQRETVVLWDPRTGEPRGNAIVWQDTRTRELCQELAREGGPDRFRAATGLPLSTYFSGPKVRWALDRDPSLRAAAARGRLVCGTIDSWLVWWLTGGPEGGAQVTDVTNASRTLLLSLATLDWDDELLDALGVPRAMLPRVVPSSDSEGWGWTSPSGPFGGRVLVCGALGDQHAALLGHCCSEPGDAKCTYGTGCFLLANTGPTPVPSRHGLVTTLAWQLSGEPARYALEGSIAVAGDLIGWLHEKLGIGASADEVERLAASVDDNGGVYVVPAFSGLFAPHWRPDARGTIVGLTAYATRAHLARAALEATAFQVHDVVEAMRADAGLELPELRVSGGMTRNELLMRFQADLLGVPVAVAAETETTALGAAYAAGLAAGVYPGLPELRATRAEAARFTPSGDTDLRQRLLHDWRRALERSLGWVV